MFQKQSDVHIIKKIYNTKSLQIILGFHSDFTCFPFLFHIHLLDFVLEVRDGYNIWTIR